jgi:alkyl hydroperoxide reductase subunit AhpC
MSLRINSEAPNFTAETTQGVIDFHDWVGNGWAILFSHPKDFTPVCTTELGYLAGLKPEFDRRNCKIIGLSVDPVGHHRRWMEDIEETQGHAVTYPIIGDPALAVAKLYDMLPDSAGGSATDRTAADNATVRSVFVIGPDKKIKAVLTYPMSCGASACRCLPADRQIPGRHTRQLEARRRRDHRPVSLGRGGQREIPGRLEGAKALPADRLAAALDRETAPAPGCQGQRRRVWCGCAVRHSPAGGNRRPRRRCPFDATCRKVAYCMTRGSRC